MLWELVLKYSEINKLINYKFDSNITEYRSKRQVHHSICMVAELIKFQPDHDQPQQ